MGKAQLPKSSWRETGKLEQPQGINLKGRKDKGEGLKSIKTINKGSTKSATPQLDTWRCSGGKGESLGAEWGLGVSQATRGEVVPLLERHLVESVRSPAPSKPQRTAAFAGAGRRSLRVKPGTRCVS